MVENGKKHRPNRHLIIHCPTSEEVSERAQRSARAKQVGQSKQISEQCEWTSNQTSEWPSTYVGILGCSEPLCLGSGANLSRDNEPGVNVKLVRAGKKENDAGRKYNTTGKGTRGFWYRYPLDTEETSGELYHHFLVDFQNTSEAKLLL